MNKKKHITDNPAAEATAVDMSDTSLSQTPYVPRLKMTYYKEIMPSLMTKYGYKNVMQVPKFEKVVLNMGIGEAVADSKRLQAALEDLTAIAGQKPVITRAKKAISAFKLREGMPIGAKVTLRGGRMYDFLDHLATFVLFRIRDFRGLNTKSFDGNGNYAIGIKEHFIFPTVNYDKGVQDIGMDIIICTSAKTDNEAQALLTLSGFPFRKHG